MKYLKLFIILLLILLSANIFSLNDINEVSMESSTKGINRLSLTADIDKLLISSFSEEELESIALSFKIPNYGYEFNYNENLEFLNASTIKVPLNMYIYELAQDDPSILSNELMYDFSQYEDGSGIMQGTASGTYFSVQILLTYSIVYSDNIATNMLFEEFIVDKDTSYELIPYFGEADYENWSSTSLNRMLSLNYLYEHQEEFSRLIDDMKSSIYRDRVPKYLPDNVEVAVKTGDIYDTIHDLAIVYGENGVDCLITISMDQIDDGNSKMAKLSRDIYDIIQNYTVSP